MVLEIPLDLDEQGSADEESLDRVTVEVFDAHLLIPSTLHDAGDAYGVVAVALVDLHFQSSLGVPGVDTDDGHPTYLTLSIAMSTLLLFRVRFARHAARLT